jgi:hypothetical protein
MTDYHYWVREPSRWYEVTKEQFVAAERDAGFHNTLGQPNEPATAGFSGRYGIEGAVTTEPFPPDRP